MGRSLTLRTTDETLSRLERRARQVRMPKSALAERYIEEGLAADAFPGIVFRDGPAGRRPGLVGGPDVWEVMQALIAEGDDLQATSQTLGIRRGLVEAARAYYSAHRNDIDTWIEANRAQMEETAGVSRSPAPRPA